jgi:hypothetical protein
MAGRWLSGSLRRGRAMVVHQQRGGKAGEDSCSSVGEVGTQRWAARHGDSGSGRSRCGFGVLRVLWRARARVSTASGARLGKVARGSAAAS